MLKRFISVALLFSFLWLTLAFLQIPASTLAQDATPTPAPLFIIPTATLLPTPTLSPSQVVSALGNYGLQSTDLLGFIEGNGNGVYTLEAWNQALSRLYSEQSVVANSLTALYRTYGVVGVSMAQYFAPQCVGQAIFGLGTMIHGLVSQSNTESLANDPNLIGLYAGLYNWTPIKLEGVTWRTFSAPVSAELCSTPSTQYVLEFPVDRLLVIVSVYAPNTTDLSLVTATLQNLAGAVKQRAQPINAIIAAEPTATSVPPTPTPIVGLSPFTDSAEPSRLHSNWRHIAEKPDEDSYALASDNSVRVIATHKGDSKICHKYTGDFEVTVRVAIGEHRDHQGASLTINDPQSPAFFYLTVWDTDACCHEDIRIASGGISNTNQSIGHVYWDMDQRRAYSRIWFLKIVRSGRSIFSAHYSGDGIKWAILREGVVITMPSEVDICLRAESRREAEGFFATFDRLKLTPR